MKDAADSTASIILLHWAAGAGLLIVGLISHSWHYIAGTVLCWAMVWLVVHTCVEKRD